jgi:hypothetical protein
MGYVSRLDAYSTGSWRTRRDRVPRWGRRWKKGRLTYALCGERLALGRTRHEFALVGQRFRILVCSVVCHFELRSVTKDGPLSKFRQQAGKIRGFGFYNSENETNPNHSVNITHETTTDDERWILFLLRASMTYRHQHDVISHRAFAYAPAGSQITTYHIECEIMLPLKAPAAGRHVSTREFN